MYDLSPAMAKKFYLDSRSEPVLVTLIGISCHLKDYRLSYLFSQYLGLSLIKLDDLQVSANLNKNAADFSFYFCRDDDHLNTYFLLTNRSQDFILVPELKQFDFLLFIEGKFLKTNKEFLIKTLRQIPGILTIFERNSSEIRNFDRLLNDVELHVMNLLRLPRKKYPSLLVAEPQGVF